MNNPYRKPFVIRTSGMGVATDAKVTVRGVEVVQTVQTLANSVALIAGKPALVRVYLAPSALNGPISVSGELTWRSNLGGANYLPALNRIQLDPGAALAINDQRIDLGASLNFRLPVEALNSGFLELVLNRVYTLDGTDLSVLDVGTVRIEFLSAPLLRVRAIGFRYKINNSKTATPNAIHFSFMRSFLLRAYPIATLDWSQIVVDADFAPPFDKNTPVLANAQLAAIRSRDVSNGTDPRTHYYGLVDDAGGEHFMRGQAFTIPDMPRPDTVASGPVGVPNGFSGDQDKSYADWYSAHELGHTFGRYHPGFPPYNPETGSGQDASDPQFPYPDGQISFNRDFPLGNNPNGSQ